LEDDKILQLYFDRNEDAIKQTSEKYGSKLQAVSYRITCDRETAEECENDTYMKTWNLIPPNSPKDYFFAFLARITRALSIDRVRENTRLKRNGHIVELTDEMVMCIPAVNDVADDVEAKLLGETISRFLFTLSDEKQVMFVRRYFYLDTVSDIAKRLAISESKVKTTLFRIRNELRDFLIGEGYTL